MRTREEVIHAFTPVGKLTQSQQHCLFLLQKKATDFATDIIDLVPSCADRTAALRLLLQAKQTCIQAITHEAPHEQALNTKKPTPPPPPGKTEARGPTKEKKDDVKSTGEAGSAAGAGEGEPAGGKGAVDPTVRVL